VLVGGKGSVWRWGWLGTVVLLSAGGVKEEATLSRQELVPKALIIRAGRAGWSDSKSGLDRRGWSGSGFDMAFGNGGEDAAKAELRSQAER